MPIPLVVPLLLSAAPAPPTVTELPDPPVQVWFDRDGNYDQGDRVRLFARADRDGYMVILHADLEGRVRVLFPLDPVQDDFVRGGQTLEILGRGEEGAFSIVQPEGYGTVLAAWSPDPYYRDGLVRGDHWDYRVIAPNGVGDDAEAGLLEIVHAMAGNQPFEYHTAQYLVGYPVYDSSPTYSISLRSNVCVGCSSWGWDYSRFGFSFSFGTPHWSIWYHDDPWYRPSYRKVHYYDPWRYSYGVPIWRPAYWYDPWYDPWWSWRPVRYYHGPRVAVGIRYAGCWDCGPRWRQPYRPGRATGVSFGDAYWTRGERGVATGIAWASGDGYRSPSGQGMARDTGPTRYAVPKGGETGRGTGTAQPSRVGQTRPVVTSTPPSRTRSIADDPVRGTARNDQRIRGQVQPSRAPVVSSTPQNNGIASRPDRNAVVRSGTQATPPSSDRGAVRRGIGSSNDNTRVVPQARTSNGIATRPSERSSTIRGQAVPRTSTSNPPASSSRAVPRNTAPTRMSPPARSSGGVGSASRSSGVSRAVPSRSSGSSSQAAPTRSSGASSRAAPTRSSGPAPRAAPTRSSGASSRAAPTRSSGSSGSGGVASRASSSRGSSGSASSRSGGSARSRSGGGG